MRTKGMSKHDELNEQTPESTGEFNENTSETEKGSENEAVNHDNTSDDILSKMGFSNKKDKHKKEIEQLKQENEELKQKVAELNDKTLRLYAEFENFKKRNAKERIEWFKTAAQDVISDLLPVLDDFSRAIKQLENAKDTAAVKEGVVLIQNKLQGLLESRGLKAMQAVGTEFNPDLHDAITEIDVKDEGMKGKVVEEVVKGYYLNDKIIRHAKVVVGK
jgi:molecular chaperone GrpE